MKYRGRLFLCALLLLSGCLYFSGCSAAPQRQETPMTAPSPAWPETTEAMKDFLTAHQAEMEEIVAVMMEYSSRETENEYTTFWYSVKWQKLHQSHTVIEKDVHGPGPQEVGVFTEHPIITKIRALGEEPGFDFAAADFSHRIVDNDICYFSGCVNDDAGSPYTDAYLFYCEEEPVEQEYFYIYPVIPHWYLYIEYLE